MKVKILKPGKRGPDFTFPVVFESSGPNRAGQSIYIQIEYQGKFYTFSVKQFEDGLQINGSDGPLAIEPRDNNTIIVRGPESDPGRYPEQRQD